MARELIFTGTKESSTHGTHLKCFINMDNAIFISIDSNWTQPEFICLDLETAESLIQELKELVNQIKSN